MTPIRFTPIWGAPPPYGKLARPAPNAGRNHVVIYLSLLHCGMKLLSNRTMLSVSGNPAGELMRKAHAPDMDSAGDPLTTRSKPPLPMFCSVPCAPHRFETDFETDLEVGTGFWRTARVSQAWHQKRLHRVSISANDRSHATRGVDYRASRIGKYDLTRRRIRNNRIGTSVTPGTIHLCPNPDVLIDLGG